MKLAITDACIFIDLHILQLTVVFFELDIEIHTSFDVFNELNDEQQQLLAAFRSVGSLTIHTIKETDRNAIFQKAYPKALSEMDKTVLHLASQLDAIVLSSDKAVRNCAKTNCIEYHGMLWIFDQLIGQSRISLEVGSAKLQELLSTNYFYQNNAILVSEIHKRLKSWKV